MQAQEEGAISLAYGLELPYWVLMTFETEGAMRAVMKRIHDDRQFAESEPYFAFNTLDRIKNDFSCDWYFFSGSQGAVF